MLLTDGYHILRMFLLQKHFKKYLSYCLFESALFLLACGRYCLLVLETADITALKGLHSFQGVSEASHECF